MTIAIDAKTGRAIGQLLPMWNAPLKEWPRDGFIRILTRAGTVDVPRSSVRLEELR